VGRQAVGFDDIFDGEYESQRSGAAASGQHDDGHVAGLGQQSDGRVAAVRASQKVYFNGWALNPLVLSQNDYAVAGVEEAWQSGRSRAGG